MKNETLKAIADRRLQGMGWQGAELVLAQLAAPGRQPMPATRRRARLGLIFALLLTLLLGTALALGLHYSAAYSANKAADAALIARYGFDPQAIGMFYVQQTGGPDGQRFTYRAHMVSERIGEYTVLIAADGQARASWSFDAADPAVCQNGSLQAPVWGSAQVNTYVRLKNAYYNKSAQFDWDNVAAWTLQERAQVDDLLQQMQLAYGETDPQKHIAPTAGDLSRQQAIELAKDHLVRTYGVGRAWLDRLQAVVSFVQAEDHSRRYDVQLRLALPRAQAPAQSGQCLQVQLLSPSGQIVDQSWENADPAQRTLPDGDLRPYRLAVAEYIQSGAFAALDAGQKAALARRIHQAGHQGLLNGVEYLSPGPGLLSQQAAERVAQQALQKRWQVPAPSLALFGQSAALVAQDGRPVWDITYTPLPLARWEVHSQAPIGSYRVRLAAQAGQVLAADWSLAGVENATFTQQTWGRARAYGGRILPWLMQLLHTQKTILDKYPGEGDWYFMSVADTAAYDALFRRNGFSPHQFPAGLPRAGDLTQQQAQALANQALKEELHISDERLAQMALIYPSYLLDSSTLRSGTPNPSWFFQYHHPEGIYVVCLDAQSGQVLLVQYDPAAAGNG